MEKDNNYPLVQPCTSSLYAHLSVLQNHEPRAHSMSERYNVRFILPVFCILKPLFKSNPRVCISSFDIFEFPRLFPLVCACSADRF